MTVLFPSERTIMSRFYPEVLAIERNSSKLHLCTDVMTRVHDFRVLLEELSLWLVEPVGLI
jgi:hypothetical protein